MSVVTLINSALISSYSAFPKSIPLAVESLLCYGIISLHREIFVSALAAWIPFLPFVKPVLGTLIITALRVLIWILSRCFQFLQHVMISIALRKRYFYDRVSGRIRQGTRQVLLLGAGYDALATMLAEMYPTVLFVEVDEPSMSERKKNIIWRTGKRLNNLVFVGVDLSCNHLEDILLNEVPEWNITTKSVVTAENLLMYFEPGSVRRVMHSIRQLTPTNTMVIFSYAQKDSSLNLTCQLSHYFPKICKWVANDAEEVASMIEGGQFYADLAPHESDLYKKYLRENPFGINNHPLFRNAYGMAMSR